MNTIHSKQHIALDFIESQFFKAVNTIPQLKGKGIADVAELMDSTFFKKEFLKVTGPCFVKVVLTKDQTSHGLPGKFFYAANEHVSMYYFILNNGKDMVYGNDSGSVWLTAYQSTDEYYAITSGLEEAKTSMIDEILKDFAEFIPQDLSWAFGRLGS
jgi:hypothetical protein